MVFPTKHRRNVFTTAVLDDARTVFASMCAGIDAGLIERDGEGDPVHRLVNEPPKGASSTPVI